MHARMASSSVPRTAPRRVALAPSSMFDWAFQIQSSPSIELTTNSTSRWNPFTFMILNQYFGNFVHNLPEQGIGLCAYSVRPRNSVIGSGNPATPQIVRGSGPLALWAADGAEHSSLFVSSARSAARFERPGRTSTGRWSVSPMHMQSRFEPTLQRATSEAARPRRLYRRRQGHERPAEECFARLLVLTRLRLRPRANTLWPNCLTPEQRPSVTWAGTYFDSERTLANLRPL